MLAFRLQEPVQASIAPRRLLDRERLETVAHRSVVAHGSSALRVFRDIAQAEAWLLSGDAATEDIKAL